MRELLYISSYLFLLVEGHFLTRELTCIFLYLFLSHACCPLNNICLTLKHTLSELYSNTDRIYIYPQHNLLAIFSNFFETVEGQKKKLKKLKGEKYGK